MRAIIIALAIAASGCATDPWTRADTRRELVFAGALAADGYTTSHFDRDPTARETLGLARDLWGPQPAAEDVLVGMVAWGALHYAIARWLPADIRRWWQYIPAGLHGKAAITNCRYNDIGC